MARYIDTDLFIIGGPLGLDRFTGRGDDAQVDIGLVLVCLFNDDNCILYANLHGTQCFETIRFHRIDHIGDNILKRIIKKAYISRNQPNPFIRVFQ